MGYFVTVPVSGVVDIWVEANNEQDAQFRAIEKFDIAAAEADCLLDEIYEFKAHRNLHEHDRGNVFLPIHTIKV